MNNRDIIKNCIDSLKKEGADKSQCLLTESKKHELNVENGEISLLRTTTDINFDITAIKDNKKGKLSINKLDEASIKEGIKNVIELCETSNEDECYDISPKQEKEEFSFGDKEPDLDKMYKLLDKFLKNVKEFFPKVTIGEMTFDFQQKDSLLLNSNGVDFKTYNGLYEFEAVFSSKEGKKGSSFNYTGCSMGKLEKDLLDYGTIKTLLKQSEGQIDVKPIEGKFVGDIIITPDCLHDITINYIRVFLADDALISKSSIFKDKLNEKVASEKFSIDICPVLDEISNKEFITSDGFKAENQTVIDKGILKAFVLSQYAANKTNGKRAKSKTMTYDIKPGNTSLDDMIKNVKKGILFCRYSGGRASSNGDLSGVAKNSFYIEDGEIKYPISETMVSGNLYDIFMNIKDVSKERVNFGHSILPWIHTSGVTISGK
ncbi:TldD/PmbA family protein [Dethiothermospora halolimnae]|uniref:TldD/PmbA family protein n=1 Tax=Dethiothermospora halolimnae TaxID=3114390 RepID=UPI003CCBF297